MKELRDDTLLKQYLAKHQIEQLFDTKDLPFRLCQYDRGEILNFIKDSNHYLHFLVSGAVHIYAVRKDGSNYPLCYLEEFTLLGDMEFCGEKSSSLLVEVSKRAVCVELPLYKYRDILLNDNTFLRYLLHSVAHKMALFSQSEASYSSLEEKLLHYLKYDCPSQTLQGVEAAAIHLRCSRRQLQRVLKSLTERGIVEKTAKGVYRLL